MRPYLAIIKDSFLEALASRVLWVLLILITLVLVALAPLSFRAEQTTKFRQADFQDARELAKRIHEDRQNEPSPSQRIWSMLDEKGRESLVGFQVEGQDAPVSYYAALRRFMESLNGLLEKRDLYDEASWEGVALGSEAGELLDRGIDQLSKDDLARLNRLLIVTSYEDSFRPQPPKQIVVTYFGAGISPPLRFSEKRVRQFIEQIILPSLIGLLVGFLAILTAVLVTAPIIPQMFDPGALSLLLSKPLSRSIMFLAKFVGGCAFILINVTYLIVGLWAIAGVRFGIWNQGLLFCIPIFLFLFAIYYSVSAFTGVVWRNAVVCVVMTVVFWLACTVVGTTKGIFEQVAIDAHRIVRLVPAGDALIALEEQGPTQRWNVEQNEWEPVFVEHGGGPMQRMVGPIYDAENNLLLATVIGNRGFFGSGGNLMIGKGSDGWMQIDGPALPEDTLTLLPDPKGRLLAITNAGIHRLVGDLDLTAKKKLTVFWMEIPQTLEKPFHFAGPKSSLKLTRPAEAAVDHRTANLAIYSRGSLMLLSRKGDEYELTKTVLVEADEEEGATIVFQGATILLALADGRVLNFDSSTLELRTTYEPDKRSQPRFACGSRDGRYFALVFHNGNLFLLDTSKGTEAQLQKADVRGQGDISAVTFLPDNQMLVADRATRVTQYKLESLASTKAFSPGLTGIEIAYYYAIVPIYTVFPKPGELDNTIQYLLKDEETTDLGMQTGDLQAKRVRLRPWAPVRSSLIFVLIVLAGACFYIERQDF